MGLLQSSTIIRKSLFDECQGERYEELMLALSNLTLKTSQERLAKTQSQVYVEAVTPYPSIDTIQPLVLAYQFSLQNKLEERTSLKHQWKSLADGIEQLVLLGIEKANTVKITTKSRPTLKLKEDEISGAWRKNWLGSDSSLDIILCGQRTKEEPHECDELFGHFSQQMQFASHGQKFLTPIEKFQAQHARQAHQNNLWRAKLTNRVSSSQSIVHQHNMLILENPSAISLANHQKLYPSQGLPQDTPSTLEFIKNTDYGSMFQQIDVELATICISRRINAVRKALVRSPNLNRSNEEHRSIITSTCEVIEARHSPVNQADAGDRRDHIYESSKVELQSNNPHSTGAETMSDDFSDAEVFSEFDLTSAQVDIAHVSASTPEPPIVDQPFSIEDFNNDTSIDVINIEEIISSVTNAAYTPNLTRAVRHCELVGTSPRLMDTINDEKIPEDIFKLGDYDSVFKSRPKIALSPPTQASFPDDSIGDEDTRGSFSFEASPLKNILDRKSF